MKKRIFSLLLSFVVVFSCLISPVYALPSIDINVDINPVEFFDWTLNRVWDGSQFLVGCFNDDVCKYAPGQNPRHNFVEQRTSIDGKTGLYYVCEYCGKSAGEVAEEAYNEYVQELPATSYSSDGSLLYSPVHSYMFIYQKRGGFSYHYYCEHYAGSDSANFTYTFNCALNSVSVVPLSGQTSFGEIQVYFYYEGIAPIEGYYTMISSPSCSGYYFDVDGVQHSFDKNWNSSSSTFRSVGAKFNSYDFYMRSGSSSFLYASCLPPVYKVTPVASLSVDTYNINTRPTTITGGNYGIVGENGTINTVTNNNKIVNETNNTYYNPATGQSSTITDWSYNYDGRIYNLTLDTGDKVQVEYGDQNITITENNVVEGDTIVNNYIIYYIVDGSGSDTPDPTPAPTVCTHNWQESSRTDPGCTSPGKVVYICSQCGVTRSETLKALGHDWQVERTVKTLYDEDGNVTQQGYTIYECTVCGEQYKDADSTGPPDGSVNDGGLIEWLNGLIKSLSDNLSGVVSLIQRFFSEIPKLFGGFLDFLSAMFPFLPEEIILLFTFGMAAVVVIGIIKAIRR